MKPEREARRIIDEMLKDSGWIIQDYDHMDLGKGSGIAVREFQLSKMACDYALFLDENPIGVIEAKKIGTSLTGITKQSEEYIRRMAKKFPNSPRVPPFSYESTGIETQFSDRRDPDYRSRNVFTFHKPEALREYLREPSTLRAKLKTIPKLDYQNLWACQKEAIINLEDSFSQNRPRALIQMATGSGKTFTAVTSIYRLVKFAKAKRILFLVDRNNLGRQALREFQQYETPDDGRKFTKLYNVQHLQSQTIDDNAVVVISTVQRMYSILKGEEEFDESSDEYSEFESIHDYEPVEIKYNKKIPIGKFDFIIIDECHRSIYNKWKQILDYFDAFLVGLTATPSKHTIGFFNNNQVMSYTHERAVADGINVSYNVYRIITKIGKEGGIIDRGTIVEKRDKMTREKRYDKLDEDIIFTSEDLDRIITVPDQIRLIMKTFKERLPDIFPGRTSVPKTLIFAKNDNHAEDITKITREEFAKGNEFCQKITYRTSGETPENLIKSFRNSSMPRIAVSVDMIATGTDIKPLECIIFLRNVKSRNYFDQMKGRGTRVIKPDDLQAVTSDAKFKDHFVIIDAIGLCEQSMTDTYSLNRTTGISFEQLMQKAIERRANEDDLKSLAYRISMLDKSLDNDSKKEIENAAGGRTISQIINKLLDGTDTDKQFEKAKKMFGKKPNDEQIKKAVEESIKDACRIFSAKLKKTILDVKKKNEIIVDTTSIDELVSAGFDEQAKRLSNKTIESFKEFIEKNKDELVALDIIYSKPYRMREITFNDIKNIANKIKIPPHSLTPELLWSAYANLDRSKVKDNPRKTLVDLISIIRYSTGRQNMLESFQEVIDKKFEKWMSTQEYEGKQFTAEQKEWLVMIKDHIAASAQITKQAMELVPFVNRGGLIKFQQVFGNEHEKILSELHDDLMSSV